MCDVPESVNREPWFEAVRILMTAPGCVNHNLPLGIGLPWASCADTIPVFSAGLLTELTVSRQGSTTVQKFRDRQGQTGIVTFKAFAVHASNRFHSGEDREEVLIKCVLAIPSSPRSSAATNL